MKIALPASMHFIAFFARTDGDRSSVICILRMFSWRSGGRQAHAGLSLTRRDPSTRPRCPGTADQKPPRILGLVTQVSLEGPQPEAPHPRALDSVRSGVRRFVDVPQPRARDSVRSGERRVVGGAILKSPPLNALNMLGVAVVVPAGMYGCGA